MKNVKFFSRLKVAVFSALFLFPVILMGQSPTPWNIGGNTIPGGLIPKVGTNNNNPLHLITDSITRMTILPNGFVGLGTQNPLGQLHIHEVPIEHSSPVPPPHSYFNCILMTNDDMNPLSRSNGFIIYQAFKEVTLRQQENAPFNLYNAQNKGMTIASDGNIGVGIQAPTTNFQLHAEINRFPNRFSMTNSGIMNVKEYCSMDGNKKIYTYNVLEMGSIGYDENCNTFLLQSEENTINPIDPDYWVWIFLLSDGTI
jgi:hypothetical protein